MSKELHERLRAHLLQAQVSPHLLSESDGSKRASDTFSSFNDPDVVLSKVEESSAEKPQDSCIWFPVSVSFSHSSYSPTAMQCCRSLIVHVECDSGTTLKRCNSKQVRVQPHRCLSLAMPSTARVCVFSSFTRVFPTLYASQFLVTFYLHCWTVMMTCHLLSLKTFVLKKRGSITRTTIADGWT